MVRSDARTSPLQSLFPEGVAIAVASVPSGTCEADLSSMRGCLLPGEEACVAAAVPKRRLEFAAGRTCARRALARLGVTDYPLLPGPDRVPVWPPGVIGSISHTDGFCGVALTRQGPLAGIGLDIESSRGLDEQYWPLVLCPSEQRWLGRFCAGARGRLAKLMFSAKECAYKCQYCVSRRRLEFADLEVAVDLKRGEFISRFPKDVMPNGARGSWLNGRFVFYEDWVLTGSLFVFTNTAQREE